MSNKTEMTASVVVNTDVNGEEEIKKLSDGLEKTGKAAGRAAEQTDTTSKSVKKVGAAAEKSALDIEELAQKLKKLAKGYLGFQAAKKSIEGLITATRELQALQTRFNYAFDGAENGAKQLAFVREEANRLGLELNGAANGYAQLAAATKNLNISQEQTQSIFSGVASAVAGMGLSAEEANGVFLALSQIAGKGKVSMEELRGQLGERLTPAMSIAAQAMGVTTAELEKMVERGISAERFLPRFGDALQQAFGDTAAQNVHSLNGQINVLKNSFNDFLINIGETGAIGGVQAVIGDISQALNFAQEQINAFAQSSTGEVLKDGLNGFYELIKQIGVSIIDVFNIVKGVVNDTLGILAGGNDDFSALQAVLDGVNLTVGAMRDGISALQIAFNLFAGAVRSVESDILRFASKLTFGDVSQQLVQMADKLFAKAQESYARADELALNFDSKTRQILNNMLETGNSAGKAYDEAAKAAKEATTASEAQAQALTAEEQQAQALEQTYKNAQSAASELGLNIQAATSEVSAATANALSNVQTLADSFDALKQKGVNAGQLIQQALSGSLKNAVNEEDINAIKTQFQTLGEQGKLAMQDVESGILAADMRLQELKGNIDPVAAAFKKLGIQSQESTRLAAEEMRQAFLRVKESGQASTEALNQAFAKVANAVAQTGDDAQQAWVNANASAYQYQASVQAATKSTNAHTDAVSRHTKAVKENSHAQKENANAHKEVASASASSTRTVTANLDTLTASFAQWASKTRQFFGSSVWGIVNYENALSRVYKDVETAQNRINTALKTGKNLDTAITQVLGVMSEHAGKLNKTTLNNFQAAIDNARQKMQALADEAKNARLAAQKELMQLEGKDEQLLNLEKAEKIAQLKAKQQQAMSQGNRQAVNEYQQAINATNKVYALKKAQQDKQQEEQIQVELDAKNQQLNALKNAKVDIDIKADTDALIDVLKEKVQQGSQDAVDTLLKELTQSLARQR